MQRDWENMDSTARHAVASTVGKGEEESNWPSDQGISMSLSTPLAIKMSVMSNFDLICSDTSMRDLTG